MNLEITNDNLPLLLSGKISAVASIYANIHKCSILDAIRKFYKTKVYQQLQEEETKLWHLGAVALFEMWKEEGLEIKGQH